jgi:hypothetical protein
MEYLTQANSLFRDTAILNQNILSFFAGDTTRMYTKGMPIHRLSEIKHLIPPPENWFAITIIFLFVYLILAQIVYSFNIRDNIKGLWKIHSLDTVGFEKQIQYSGYILAPISAFVYAFYVYFYLNPRYLHFNLDYLYLIFALGIGLLFFAKTILEKGLSIIFNTSKTFEIYFSDHLFLLGLSSLIQAPLLVIYIYSENTLFLWLSFHILLLLWFFRLFRSSIIGFKHSSFSKFYIFLYLCSLEILPLVIGYKMICN